MSFLSKLFGSGAKKEPEPEIHNDFRIFADPVSEPGGYRIAARIEKDIDGEVKIHNLIRADTVSSLDEATQLSINKAKQLIDQQGEQIF